MGAIELTKRDQLPHASEFEGRTFIIHSMPRAASTSFRVWFNQQNDIVSHGEIFGPNKVLSTSHKQKTKFSPIRRNRNPRKFLKTYFCDHDVQYAGFKALSSHLIDRQNLPALRWFFDTKPKVIQLYRKDLVARYKSTLYHRLRHGTISQELILNFRTEDVEIDCLVTQEQWRMAHKYWIDGLDVVRLNIKEIGADTPPQVEALMGIKFDGELGHNNAEASKKAQTANHKAVKHLEKICEAASLDQYRDVNFD
ncbi:MAG: hypothetical protein HKN36_05465 [Hellea sp.]|nr:hypothetical protein [Hellea sp.]